MLTGYKDQCSQAHNNKMRLCISLLPTLAVGLSFRVHGLGARSQAHEP